MTRYHYIGRGLYSIREACRLSGVPEARIRRWLHGYFFLHQGERRFSSPVVERPRVNDDDPVFFADLLEIRFLDAFREYGVSWSAIRIAAARARRLLHLSHPFSSRKFMTDGRTILARIADRTVDEMLIDLVRNQYEFSKVITPMLYAGIDFSEFETPVRWWPLGRKRRVVIDPTRSFGAPIVVEGVRTDVLAMGARAERAQWRAAEWYGVETQSVRDAVRFEVRYGLARVA